MFQFRWIHPVSNNQISQIFLIFILTIIVTFSDRTFADIKDSDWNQIDPASAPSARFGQSLVTLPDGRVVVFGGEDAYGNLHNDMYKCDQEEWAPVIPYNQNPAPRRDHEAWIREDHMIVSGGLTSTGFTDEHLVFRDDF